MNDMKKEDSDLVHVKNLIDEVEKYKDTIFSTKVMLDAIDEQSSNDSEEESWENEEENASYEIIWLSKISVDDLFGMYKI